MFVCMALLVPLHTHTHTHTHTPKHTHPQLILSDDLKTIELLASVCKDHHAELASTLVQLLCNYDKVVPIITACLAKSVESEGEWV